MDEDERDYEQESFEKALFELVDDPRAHDVDMIAALTTQLRNTIAVDLLGERREPDARREHLLRAIKLLTRYDPYPEIIWNSMGVMIDEREPPEGLANGGYYQIRRDVDYGCWLVGWIPVEEIHSPPPRGSYVGRGATLAEVKTIAEQDYRSRRYT